MRFEGRTIDDVVLITPKKLSDPGGYFIETFRADIFETEVGGGRIFSLSRKHRANGSPVRAVRSSTSRSIVALGRPPTADSSQKSFRRTMLGCGSAPGSDHSSIYRLRLRRQQALPYIESAPVAPPGVYGRDKPVGGEQNVDAETEKHAILRTAWIYSAFSRNFLRTMLKLAQARHEVSIVDDQIGNSTSAIDIADTIIAVGQYLLASNERTARHLSYGRNGN